MSFRDLSSTYAESENMAEEWVTESNEMVVMDEPMGQAELPEVKLFGKWSLDEVHVSDISLVVRFFFLLLLHLLSSKLLIPSWVPFILHVACDQDSFQGRVKILLFNFF
ncbi:unnamed protein product [Anisakis simplex]|uniref:Ribosomal protein n=1 Tax=Anisakis simplex TaxID=6269 RepID=A0A0M3JB38_ANISI|nr:unnamed protein product [Anisakis simplex]